MDKDGASPSYTLIRDLPLTDRPRERLRDAGAGALSSAELLAILLRIGGSGESALAQATRLLARFQGLSGLARAPFAELCNEKGIGEAKAAQIKAALELGVRLSSTSQEQRQVLRSPEDIADLVLTEMSLLEQEQVRVLLLDARNTLISLTTVYTGSVHTAQVRIGELFADAVRTKASGLVLIHNHPSGDPTPSAADIQMTQQVVEAARLLDVDFLDHMVIGGGRYVSMKALRLGFPAQAT